MGRAVRHENGLIEYSTSVSNLRFRDIDAYFLRMILGSYLGGLDAWPVANQLLKCFETGGLPCGWIGPEFKDGGHPHQCMQVLHFG